MTETVLRLALAGAAASLGILAARRSQMARLCATTVGGTTDSGLVRGLRRKLEGRARVRIAAPSYEDLRPPCLVPIRLPGRIGHSLLLEERTAEEVTVADPLMGRRRMSRGRFEACWLGSSIWVERTP